MKIKLKLLQRFVQLPTLDLHQLRALFDELGLEVKDIVGSGTDAEFTIETLANRGDHLCALGMAREISARSLLPISMPNITLELPTKKTAAVIKRDTDKCSRYSLQELSVPLNFKLPTEVADILGTQSIKHPIVDTLNYVQQELGQPMHAFDHAKIVGEIIIRLTSQEEQIEALDWKTYKIPAETIVICDREKIVAVGGIIGCSNSMVTSATERVLIESATFDPISIRKSRMAMGLSTDASAVFERGSDLEQVVNAQKRVNHLCCGKISSNENSVCHPLGFSISEGGAPEKRLVKVDLAELRRQINAPRLDRVEILTRLKHLGLQVASDDQKNIVEFQVPTWRLRDLRNPEDITEEFVRVHGLNAVKQVLPALDYEAPRASEIETIAAEFESVLHANGFVQVITKPYYSAQHVKSLEELKGGVGEEHLRIINSIESSYSHLKVTNVLHMSEIASRNLRMGVGSVKLYDFSRFFNRNQEQGVPYQFEDDFLTFVFAGRWDDNEWRKAGELEMTAAQFKGVIESLFEIIRAPLEIVASDHAFLHPGVRGDLKSGRTRCGSFGLIHPSLKDRCDLKRDLFYCELRLRAIEKVRGQPEFKEPIDFPSVKRDLTIKIPLKQLAAQLVSRVEAHRSGHLQTVQLIDDFKRDGEDFRRLTLRFVYQKADGTLESSVVDSEFSELLKLLVEKYKLEVG